MRQPLGSTRVNIGSVPCWKQNDKLYRIRQPEGDGLLGWQIRGDGLLDTIVRERGKVVTLVPGDPDRCLCWEDIKEDKLW
jgi:hypothetical protein